jgi:hypothetical protein
LNDPTAVAASMATDLAANMEREIEKALRHFYGGDDWDEDHLSVAGALVHCADGSVEFCIDMEPLVTFGPIEVSVEIVGTQVQAHLKHSIITRKHGSLD